MNSTLRFLIFAAGLQLLTVVLAGPLAIADDLDVSASTPDVTIRTRPPGRNFIRLPALEFRFAILARCQAARRPTAISLSIADTHVSALAGAPDSGAAIELTVSIPAEQIGPVAVATFCENDGADQATDVPLSVRIPSVLSAQAAMLCADDTSSQMTYTSKPLDVMIYCERQGNSET